MKQTTLEWYEEQTEKSLLYQIYREVRFLSTVVKVWLILTVLGVLGGCLYAMMTMTGTNWFGLDF